MKVKAGRPTDRRRFRATRAEIKTDGPRIYRSMNALRESTIKRALENGTRGRGGRIVRSVITPTTFITDTTPPFYWPAYFRSRPTTTVPISTGVRSFVRTFRRSPTIELVARTLREATFSELWET